jgi:hypothetical protein
MSSGAQETHEAIVRFLRSSRKPAIQDAGEELLALEEGRFAIEVRGGKLTIEAWNEATNIARRITGVKDARPGRLELTVERFGRREGTVVLVDLARGREESIGRKAARASFRERFRRFLSRQYPEWKIAELTTEPDLQHSLSPAYPRAHLRKGRSSVAAIGAAGPEEADGVLTFGLIWLDYLRRREPGQKVESLALFVPLRRAKNTCVRLGRLDAGAAGYAVFAFSEEGIEERIDPRDHGNIDTRLEACPDTGKNAGVTPEARLEAAVRSEIEVIDAGLLPSPVYGQVPTVAGVERGVIDLLAADRTGRLAVIELKAAQDLQLPLQALDYWIRVNWHAGLGEFASRGYFPGTALRRDSPKLLLVAPALEFHPSTETILRYFSPDIEVERVGLAVPWQNGLRVLFRARGAQTPLA